MNFRSWSLLKKLSSSIWEILSGRTFRRLLFFLLSKILWFSLYILLTEYPIKPYFRYIFYSAICFTPNILGKIWKSVVNHILLHTFSYSVLRFTLIFGLWAIFPGSFRIFVVEETGEHGADALSGTPCTGLTPASLSPSHQSDSGELVCNPRAWTLALTG